MKPTLPLVAFTIAFALFGLFILSVMQPVAAQGVDWPELALVDIGADVDQPIYVTHAGDGSGRLFVVERPGRIRIIKDGELLVAPFLNISPKVDTRRECGMLSMAFPPDFADSGEFYVYYSSNTNVVGENGNGCDTVVARFSLSQNSDVANPLSEEPVLLVDQPQANHNGGLITFGPDGYLYIGLGDGGSSDDPSNQGQTTDTLLGKMLRVDVTGTDVSTYTVPSSNPYVAVAEYRPEIWAWGLRNPWRYSFDRETGDLYIADVGEGAYEEIDMQPITSAGGENYGWKVMEGAHCRPPTTGCDTSGLTLPVWEYSHEGENRSITGGYVYRGGSYPRMQGVYFYADYITGQLWGLVNTSDGWQNQELLSDASSLVSFGEDENGRLYAVDITGSIYELTDSVVVTTTPTATITPTVTITGTVTPMVTPTAPITTTATATPTTTATATTVPTGTPSTPTPTGSPSATPPLGTPTATPDGGTASTPPPGGSAGRILYLPLVENPTD